MSEGIVRAIVLAAGMGTRMKSERPKVLHEICGRPMLWWVLRALQQSGVADVVVVTNPAVDAAIAALVATFSGRTIVQDPQCGTGDAVQTGLRALSVGAGTVVVAYGDMPLLTPQLFADVLAAADESKGGLALVTARMPLPSNFGRVIRSGATVAKIVEERDCTPAQRALDEMNAGVYAYAEPALRSLIDELTPNNAQHELYLTDTVELFNHRGLPVVPVKCADERVVLGVNDRIELATARNILNRRLCDEHMRAGVTIIDPATTYLEPDVIIGSDSVVYPNTAIGGETTLGRHVAVGPGARLSNAIVGDGAQITESVVLDSRVGARVHVGPYAHLRSGNVLADDVFIGNFVELKKTTMHAGAKASHLTYLGDAEIGERTNIGAGTITCNFDGRNKHRTEVGARAFIGSNSTLVAPLRIGDDALTGGGSVVIRDVADGERVAGNPARLLPKKTPV